MSIVSRQSMIRNELQQLLNCEQVDDCWSMKDGRVDGHIAVNTTRFPDGIDGLAKKVHDLGLKLGIYSSKLSSIRLSLGRGQILMMHSCWDCNLCWLPCQSWLRGRRCR